MTNAILHVLDWYLSDDDDDDDDDDDNDDNDDHYHHHHHKKKKKKGKKEKEKKNKTYSMGELKTSYMDTQLLRWIRTPMKAPMQTPVRENIALPGWHKASN